MNKEQRAIHRHEPVHGVYVCSGCGRYRVEKEVRLPATLPPSLDAEYCPVCERDQKFLKIG